MRPHLGLAVAALHMCIISSGGRAYAQKLYPVQGPMAAQTPQPVLVGQTSFRVVSTGPLFHLLKSWTFPDGEVLKGKATKVKATSVNTPAAVPANPPQPNLAFAWDAVYGQGFFVAHILGKDFWQAVFKGSQGTVLQVETLNGQRGVAVDNKGNTYKMVW